MNSGKLRRVCGSDFTISGGTASRINSDNVSSVLGSLVSECGIASWSCNRRDVECCTILSTKIAL